MRQSWYISERADRLVALSRAGLALISLFVVLLEDPGTAAQRAVYILMSGYWVFALVIVAMLWWRKGLSPRLPLITHFVDLAVMIGIVGITGGAASPLFLYLAFPLLGASLRFRARGVVWSGSIVFAAFGVMAAFALMRHAADPIEILVRLSYLSILAFLLYYFGSVHQKTESEFARLAAWPRGSELRQQDLVHRLLEGARDLLGVERVIVLWEEPDDEPFIHLAWMFGSEFQASYEADFFRKAVSPGLEDCHFFSRGRGRQEVLAVDRSGERAFTWSGTPLNHRFQERFEIGSVLSSPASGEIIRGRIFFLDVKDAARDELLLSEMVASMVLSSIDQSLLLQRLQEAAIGEDRARVARDLHDGILQSLGGAIYQLQAASMMMDGDQAEVARERIREVQGVIRSDQRNLRRFIQQLKPEQNRPPKLDRLRARLEEMRDRFREQWNLDVRMDLELGEDRLSVQAMGEIYNLVHEAVSNAARHAQASRVYLQLSIDRETVSIDVADNGVGLPYRGRYELAQLKAERRGPISLRERIDSLGGEMVVDSSDFGARLQMRFSLRAADAAASASDAGPAAV